MNIFFSWLKTRRISAGERVAKLIGSAIDNKLVVRPATVLVMIALLLPLIYIGDSRTVSAASEMPPTGTAAPPAAAPAAFISASSDQLFEPVLSAVGTFNQTFSGAYQSIKGYFISPPLPEGFEMAKAPTFRDKVSDSLSALAARFLLISPNGSSVNAGASESAQPLLTASGATKFDFTGDNKADVSRWQPSTGEWKIENSSTGAFTTDTTLGTGTSAAPADYDGDGITDRAVFTDYAGSWKILYSSTGQSQTLATFGQSGDKEVSGDYDGDGTADLAVWRPSTGTWYVRQSGNNFQVISQQWGASGDIPVPGNYDGDTKMDYAVYRPSNGTWYLLLSGTGYSYLSFPWGAAADTPVPADYDGDGKTDFAVYRPSNGTWYAYKSSMGDGSFLTKIWGNFGDQPVPADYDNDGRADFAVWRPTNGIWYIANSSANYNTYDYHQLGIAGDLAVPSAYLKQVGGQIAADSLANARLAPINGVGSTDLYSRNFGWSAGLVNLPGRAGLDAGFGISYNSLVWTKEPNSNVMVFDADHANVAPGFSFGFPSIEPAYYNGLTQKISYLMVLPSGDRVEFRQTAASNIYEAGDSSYAQLKVNTPSGGGPQTPTENLTVTVTTTDGVQMDYDWKAGAYRLNKITDRNGNFISVVYDGTYGLLTSVTDTLGRVINVNYDTEFYPTSITQQWKSGNGDGSAVTHTYATFTYTYTPITPSFAATLGVFGPAGGANIKVLNSITYADGSLTGFDYNTYGQVWRVRQLAADYHELSSTATDLETVSGTKSDCPRIAVVKNKTENFNGGAETVTHINYSENQIFIFGAESGTATSVDVWMEGAPLHTPTSRTWYHPAGNWAEGLPLGTEDIADGSQQRWSRTVWTQDDTGLYYKLNPRVTESKVGDATNTKRTSVDYLLQTGSTTASLFGLVSEVKVYDTNQTTVLKRATTDYNLNNAYLSLRIIGLPSEQKLYDGNDTLLSKVTYGYDDGDFSGTGQNIPSVIQHDNANYGANFTIGRGNMTSMSRDDVLGQTSAVTTSLKYNIAGATVAQTNPLGKTVSISYTDNFNDTISRNTFAYPTTLTDPDNYSSQIKYRFDIGANVWAKSPDLNATTTGKTTTRNFDAIGRLERQSLVGSGGAYTRYEYPTSQTQSKTFTTVTDTNSNNIADASDEVLAESFYDGAGRMIKSRTPMTFNSSGGTLTWVGQQVVFDKLGRVISQSVPTEVDGNWTPTGDDISWKWTSQEYDWKGRVTHEVGLDNIDRFYSYDGCGCAGGEITTIQGASVARDDQTGTARRTQKIYADILGRTKKTEVLNWDGGIYSTVVNDFNGRDQMTASRRYAGAEGSSTFQEATFEYDGHGRLKTSHAPEQNAGSNTTYTYFADDRPQTMTDGRGASSTYIYNNRGLVTRIDYSLPGASNSFPTVNPNSNLSLPDPNDCNPESPNFPECEDGGGSGNPPPGPYLSWTTFGYDNTGNRTNMTDSETGTTTYDYNQLSRMTAEHKQLKSSWSIPNHNFDITYDYNLIGQLKSVTDPFNQRIDYATDKAGKLKQITGTPFGATNQTVTNYINDIKYRAFGAVKEMDYGNGVQMTQTFDNRLQLEEFKVEKPGEALPYMKKNYQYYNDGRLKFSDNGDNARSTNASSNFDRSYAYDFMGRLTAARSGIEASGTPATDRNAVPYKQDYTYNAFGNVTSRNTYHWTQADNQTNAWTNNKENSWTYDADGRLKATPENKYYYDARGATVMVTLNDRRRTIQHLDGEGKAARQDQYTYLTYNYQYNLEQSVYYIYSSVLGKLLTEVKSDGTKKRTFVYGTGGVVALQQYSSTNQEVRWEHTDPSNASYVQTAASGAMYLIDSPAELDPLGSSVGFYNPYNQGQNSPQNMSAGGWGYGSWGDPFGGYSCYVDWMEQPCSYAAGVLSAGAGVIYNGPQFTHDGNGWGEFRCSQGASCGYYFNNDYTFDARGTPGWQPGDDPTGLGQNIYFHPQDVYSGPFFFNLNRNQTTSSEPPLDGGITNTPSSDPCAGRKGQLDHTKKLQHITDRHIQQTPRNVGASYYIFGFLDISTWDLPGKQLHVMALNQETFEKGAANISRRGNKDFFVYIYAEHYQVPKLGEGRFIGVDSMHNYDITNVNTVILEDDCKTVVTSHPGLPTQPSSPIYNGTPVWRNPTFWVPF